MNKILQALVILPLSMSFGLLGAQWIMADPIGPGKLLSVLDNKSAELFIAQILSLLRHLPPRVS